MKPLFPAMLLLCLSTAIKTTAQSQKALQPYSEGKWVAKLNATSWLDPETPTLQPGIEYRLNQRSSAEIAIGIPTKIYDNLKDTDTTYNHYFKIKAEIKYFPGERRSFYLAPEMTYVNKQRSRFNETFVGDDGKTYSYDYAKLDKSVIAMAFKFGFIIPFKGNNRWLMDTYFGAGPRFMYMNIDAVNRQLGGHGPMFWLSDREGFTTSIHVTFGLKVGYVLK